MKKPKIKYNNYGIANCIEIGSKKEIILNNKLKDYPRLKKALIAHEMQHYKSKNNIDFKIELKSLLDYKTNWELFKFELKHPVHFIQQKIPFYPTKFGMAVDYFTILSYLSIISLVIIGGVL